MGLERHAEADLADALFRVLEVARELARLHEARVRRTRAASDGSG